MAGTMTLSPAVKQRVKQLLRQTVGEPYVGKRLKLRWLSGALNDLQFEPSQILDAGAEDATFSYWLADRYPSAKVTATDVDSSAIEACRANRPSSYNNRVQFLVGLFADLPPSTYDLVTAFDVLEHIEDDIGALRDLRRAMTDDGRLLIHVPTNPYTDRKGVQHWVQDDQAWKINPGHVRQGYPPEVLRKRVEQAGFEVLALDKWNRRWSAVAFDVYTRLENPTPLRLLSVPITDLLAILDRRRPAQEGNTVWMVARPSNSN